MAFSRFRPSILLRSALGLAALISLSSCSNGQTLQAAGASFPAGLYQRWFADLASTD